MTNVNESVSRRDLQRDQTRARVYEAALQVFRRDGVAASKIEDVVKLAGVSRGTFYFHFPTKDDVLGEVLRQSAEPVAAAVDALDQHASVAELLEAIVAAVMGQWQGDPRLFPEVGMLAMRLTASGVLTSETDPVRASVTRRFKALAARGELSRALPAETLADVFLVSAFAILMSWARDPGGTSLDKALHHAARLFLEGARPRR